jgi:hypothetical protein
MVTATVQGDDVIDMEISDVEKLTGIAAMRRLCAEPGFQLVGRRAREIGRSTAHRRSQIAGTIAPEIGLGGEGLN